MLDIPNMIENINKRLWA